MSRQGPLFIAVRFVWRLVRPRWRTQVEQIQGPCVYICSHSNMAGPLNTLAWLPFPVRPWVLHVFFNYRSCRRQYADYTFSRRFGYPRWAAEGLALLTAGVVSRLVRSAASIPVYRGSVQAAATFRETIQALERGEAVIIYPDIDYANDSGEMGEIYRGFLLLERFWRKRHQEPLTFLPIQMDRKRRTLRSAPALQFDRGKPFEEEADRIQAALRREINGEGKEGEKL